MLRGLGSGQLHGFEHGCAHVGGGEGDFDAGFLEGFNFGIRGVAFAADDGAGVAHSAAGGSGAAGDEGGDGLFDVLADVFGRFVFVGSADFADHHDAVGVGITFEHLDDIDV